MRTYTPELKVMVAKEAIAGESTLKELMEKYDIGGESTIRGWIKLYKENGESYFFRNQPKENEQATLNIPDDTSANGLINEETVAEETSIQENKDDETENTGNSLAAEEEKQEVKIAEDYPTDSENIENPESIASSEEKFSFNKKIKGAANTIKAKATFVSGTIVRGAKSGSKRLSQRIKNFNLPKYLPKKEKEEKEEK